jgi:hypothetical protein
VSAIRERRLYGFMVQDATEAAVGARESIEKTTEEVFAEARAHGTMVVVNELPTSSYVSSIDEAQALVDQGKAAILRASRRLRFSFNRTPSMAQRNAY